MPDDNSNIEEVLKQRGSRYGDWKDQSTISIGLKNTLRYAWSDDLLSLSVRPGWARMEPYQQNALEMMCEKMARVVNGDPTYLDNYRDIMGYCQLVIDRLTKEGYGHG